MENLVTLDRILENKKEDVMSSDIFKFYDCIKQLVNSLRYTRIGDEVGMDILLDHYGPAYFQKNLPSFYNDLVERVNDPDFYGCHVEGEEYVVEFNYEKSYNFRTDEKSLRRIFRLAKTYVPEYKEQIDLLLAKIEVNKMLYSDKAIKKYLDSEELRKQKEELLRENLNNTIKVAM